MSNEDQKHKLAERLKHRRKELGLRQLDAAHEVGVKYETYVAWERRKSFPEIHHLRQAQEALGVELMDLAVEEALEGDSLLTTALEPLASEIRQMSERLEAQGQEIQKLRQRRGR